MRGKIQRSCLIALLLVWTLPLFAEGPAVAEALYSFEGNVSNQADQHIAEVVIELLSADNAVVAATQTDVDGHYMLLGVPLTDGQYRLRFSKHDYEVVLRSFSVAPDAIGEAKKLDVTLLPLSAAVKQRGQRGGTTTQIKVFYATDRAASSDKGVPVYSGTRSNAGLAFGSCDVTIPPNHSAGNIEAPSIWRLEFSPNAEEYITIRSIEVKAKTDFYRELAKSIGTSKSRDAFVFIHGYNVGFDDAVKRTAQLAYDMRFGGVPIVYSWPSKGKFYGYFDDEREIEATKENLKRFLLDLGAQSGANSIYLVAHSMGNRALLSVLSELATKNKGEAVRSFRQVIFAAPDVPKADFENLTRNISTGSPHLTLYVSAHDQALLLSRYFHHGETRAGESGNPPLLLAGLDTVDVSRVSSELLGHTYYGDCQTVISDLVRIFRNEMLPRGLEPARTSAGQFWFFMPQ
jgi:esterase/lipase superfamily enzyme